MTAIWRRQDGFWRIASPAGFDDEAALHTLIQEAPELLPLSGAPKLAILGREVYLGGNSADLVAVESSGRLVIIEVKLKKNPEARRAVVAQVLTYAAYLRGMDLATLEGDVLTPHLAKAGKKSVADVARELDQQGDFDVAAFNTQLRSSLQSGAFRLVVVLDAAPAELARLTGYLESVAEQLTVDLVTVTKYAVGSEEVLVPQRIEPSRQQGESIASAPGKPGKRAKEGVDEFRLGIATVTGPTRDRLGELIAWAEGLERDDLCGLWSFRSARGDASLLPRMRDEGVGFVTIWSTAAFTPWRSVFERRAPTSLELLDAATAKPIGQGQNVEPTAEVLRLVRRAYLEAAHRLDSPE